MKKTGKVLSLVLSLALVASSLVATTASAATAKTEYVPVTDKTSTVIYLANGLSGSSSDTTISPTIPYTQPNGIATKDHLDVGTMTATDIAYKSGSNLLSLSINSSNQTIHARLTSDSAVGTEVIAVRYTGTSYRYSDTTQPILFSAEVDYTVTVLANNSVVLSGSNTTLASLGSVNKNSSGAIDAYVLKVGRGTGSLATFTAQDVTAANDGTANHNFASAGITQADVTSGLYFVKAVSSNSTNVTTSSKKLTVNLTTASTAEFLNVGSVVAYAVPLKWDGTKAALDSANTVSKASTVDNTVLVPDGYDIKMWHGSTWALPTNEANSLTETTPQVIVKVDGRSTNVVGPYADAINVTGANIVLQGNATMYNGSVGTVTANVAAILTLNKGSVAKIDDADVSLTMSNGTVGSIAKANSVSINGGSVGSISATSVAVDATDEKVATSVGAISAETVTVNSTNAAVKTGNITAVATDGTVTGGPAAVSAQAITISGTSTTVGTIDADHYGVTVELKGYSGSIAAPLNAESATLMTTTDAKGNKTNATVTGAASIKTVNVSDGTLTFANSLNVGTVTGAGTLVIPAGAMYVSETMNSVSLKLSNAKLASGMTAFTAAPYKLYDGMFRTVGFTLDYDAISSSATRTVDTFKIKSVNFAGLTIAPASGTSNKILKGTSATFNVSPYPLGTALPDGSKINISFSGSSDNFSYTTTADSITISATKYDDLFSSLNKGTITATLVDATTDTPLYQYDAVTYDVQMIAKPETSFKIDSVPSTMKIGQQYTVKITGTDATAPQVAFAGDFAIINSKTVSGYDTFVKFTAAKSGEHGMYVSGTKVAVIKVDTASICDTKTVTKKAGQSYTFKVTSSAVSFVPQFGVASISGNIKPTKQVGKDFYYTVKATSAKGAHGVYINGVKVATYTFA